MELKLTIPEFVTAAKTLEARTIGLLDCNVGKGRTGIAAMLGWRVPGTVVDPATDIASMVRAGFSYSTK